VLVWVLVALAPLPERLVLLVLVFRLSLAQLRQPLPLRRLLPRQPLPRYPALWVELLLRA
jgi:hypothetical protein